VVSEEEEEGTREAEGKVKEERGRRGVAILSSFVGQARETTGRKGRIFLGRLRKFPANTES